MAAKYGPSGRSFNHIPQSKHVVTPGYTDNARVAVNIRADITRTIGRTPLIYLNRLTEHCAGKVAVKLESMNPLHSSSDRVAWAIIHEAEVQGKLKSDSVVIEATAGNLGISLAAICALKGYKMISVLPEFMSVERRCLLAAYGAAVIITPSASGMQGAVYKASRLAAEIPHAFFANQYHNKAAVKAHEMLTGPEIWGDTNGKVHAFVCGAGTGATASGVGKYLKSLKPSVKVIAVEPAEAAVLSGSEQPVLNHLVQGIGPGFVGDTFDISSVDEFFTVRTEQAMDIARQLPLLEGILCGISGAAVVFAALELARKPEMDGELIVALLPSSSEREISTPIFDDIRAKYINLEPCPASECADDPDEHHI